MKIDRIWPILPRSIPRKQPRCLRNSAYTIRTKSMPVGADERAPAPIDHRREGWAGIASSGLLSILETANKAEHAEHAGPDSENSLAPGCPEARLLARRVRARYSLALAAATEMPSLSAISFMEHSSDRRI